jgi:hypothetical protein
LLIWVREIMRADQVYAIAAAVLFASGCDTSGPTSSTPLASPTPPPLAASWTVSGVVSGRNGLPVSFADVALFVESNRETYSAVGDTDGTGRFALTTTAPAADGYVRVDRSFYITTKAPFTCQPPAPGARLCGDRNVIHLIVRALGIVNVTLNAPTSLKVGESREVQREIKLDDGTIIRDGGFNPALSIDDIVYTNDPSVARSSGGGDGLVRITGVAEGTTNIVTRLSGVYGSVPVRVDP